MELKRKINYMIVGILLLYEHKHLRNVYFCVDLISYSTCSTTMPGSFGHEDQDARTFAEWVSF